MLCHLSALSGYLIPFGWIIGPLVVWLIKKDEYPLVDDQGREALNFNITILIAHIVAGILWLFCIGIIVTGIVVVAHVVFLVIAAMKANQGQRYRYPFILRFL
ncbi:DUF4870 domain-containing protein [bacterium]|nr:DUF4870 domain-containing protein [bacterium]